MSNPWLTIPLADYEGHMALPSIDQAKMLADQFERLIERSAATSVAIIGCAGGNGLDRIKAGTIERVVAVDINPEYIEEARARYIGRLTHLELYCADVQSELLTFRPVDLIYAALVFEYVDVPSTIATLRRNCQKNGTLATLLQLPDSTRPAVSPSPYESLSALAPTIRLLAPRDLCVLADAAGFTIAESEVIEPPSGKQFCLQTFRAR
jgi:SAM-dependent methyltransferase